MSDAILLVDDSEIVVESLRRWLERDGYRVVVASSCAEVRTVAAKHRFAAHIFDLELRDGHGVEMALWLQKEGHFAETIFYTGHSLGSALLERAREVGHVVAKGEDPNGLMGLLRKLVAHTPHV